MTEKSSGNTTAALGFEGKLWAAANKLRGNMDAAEHKHVVLGLLFLKYISDAFMDKRHRIEEDVANPESDYFIKEEKARYEVLEDRDEYLADNIFWVPPEARWDYLQSRAKQPDIGIYGQESNYTTWRLALMILAIRGIDTKIDWDDSLLRDQHQDLKADYILANPPFNMEDWGYSKVKDDVRWRRFDGNGSFALPEHLASWGKQLHYEYEPAGLETFFCDPCDPKLRTRLFGFRRYQLPQIQLNRNQHDKHRTTHRLAKPYLGHCQRRAWRGRWLGLQALCAGRAVLPLY